MIPAHAGYLQFVVDPWAEVEIDGQHVFTTPRAAAVPLSPGLHYVKLKNPYYVEVDREVRIVTGETQVLEEELTPLHEPIPEADAGEGADDEG